MFGPKHVTRSGRGRGLPGLARLRREFHRFREEVGCIRSLPSLHRRWPSLARLEIDSEASSEDGALWDSNSEELLHGVSAPATAHGETEGIDHGGLVSVTQDFSDVGLETSHDFLGTTRLCGVQWSEQGCAEVRNYPVQFDEGLAKCDNEWGSEKIVDQFEEDNHHRDDVQLNLLLCHKRAAESLGGLEPDPNFVDVEHLKERHEFAKPNFPCEDSANSKDGSESEHSEGSRRENQEDERKCALEALDGLVTGVDVACTRNSVEDVGKIGLDLAEDAGRRLSDRDVGQQKVDDLDETEEVKYPHYTGGGVGFLPLQFDMRHEADGELHRASNETIGYCSTREETVQNIEEFSAFSHDTTSTEPRSSKFWSDDEIVDYAVSHSGARIAATPYFTANPYHKFGQRSSVPHRHIERENEGSTKGDIQSPIVSSSASRKEEEYCNQQFLSNFESHFCSLSKTLSSPTMDKREQTSSVVGTDSLEEGEGTNDLRDLKPTDTQGNVSSVQSLQSISSGDCKRTLKLVGYVYEEVQPKVAAQMPDHKISREMSSPISNPAQNLPVELANGIVRAPMMTTAVDGRSLQPLVTEVIATVNNLTPGSSQTNTAAISTASEAEINDKPVLRQGGGISSLIALTGLESLSRLGDDSNRDSGLAARMATRIRHALETLGERSHSKDKSRKGSAGFRAPTGIVSSNDGRNFRMTTGSNHPKLKIVGDRQRYSERWDGSDASGLVDSSGDSVRPEEPEMYLQQVIAALDTEQDLSEPSDVALKTNDTRPHKHPSAQSMTPQVHKEEDTNVSSLNPVHNQHGAHDNLSQLHKTGCPLHATLKPCDLTDVKQERSEHRHLNSGCLHFPKFSCVDRKSAKIDDEAATRVISNSCQHHRSVDEIGTANPQAFSVKISGSMVEIEVGEQPPSIIWTPRGQSDHEVVRTSPHQTQKQSLSEDAYDESYGATTSSSRNIYSTQAHRGPITFTDPNTTQFIENSNRVVRFRESILPGKVSKSVRFHSPATNSSKNRFYSPKHIHESFDRTVKSLAQKVQGLGENEASGEAVAESQPSPRLIQRRVQLEGVIIPPELRSKRRLSALSPESHICYKSLDNEFIDTFSGRNRHGVVVPAVYKQVEETCRSILKSPRGASELDSELQDEHHQERSQVTEVTDRIKHFESAVARPSRDTQVMRGKRSSILKSPSRQATSSSDCTSSVNHDEDEVSKTDERQEMVEAAAAGLANELQVLMRSRTPEISKDQDQYQDDDSMESDVHGSRKVLLKHRQKKLPGHFRPKKQSPPSQECGSPGYSKKIPGLFQSTYRSIDSAVTSTCENRLTGHFRSADQAGSSYLISEHKKKPSGRLRSSTQPHQLRRISQNGISVLATGEGRDRFVYRESQQQSHNNMTRAKKIVKDRIGDDFDYDRFHKELGELATERKRVEWLGQKLWILQPHTSRIRQKKDMKHETLDLHKPSNPRPMKSTKKEIGSSGNKRLRSAISPLRESGKKMFRSDSGKKAFSVEPTLQDQLLPCRVTSRDDGLDIMSSPKVHSLTGSGGYSLAYDFRRKVHESDVLSKLQGAPISRRPPHKLVTGFKSCIKKGGLRKSSGFPKLETNRVKFSFLEGGELDRPLGDQFAIKRKNLRPPGSTFPVAMPVFWFPNETTRSTGQKKDLWMSASTILETRGTGETAPQSLLKAKDGKGTKRGNKMGSKGIPQGPELGQNSLNEAEHREGHNHARSGFSSDFCKWVLTPSSVDLHNQKDSILKAELVRVESKATKSKASDKRTAKRTSERHSWSERMRAFLVSCGALLTESNTSKHSKRPPCITRHDKGDNLYHVEDVRKMSTMHPKHMKEGPVLPKFANTANAEDRELKPGSRTREFARNEPRLTPGVERPGNEKCWGSPIKFGRQLNVDDCDGGVTSPKEKTKVDKNVIGQKKAHDLLLTMLNKVSTGKSKHNRKVKPKSLRDATKDTKRAPGSLGEYSSTLVSLKVKDRARLPSNKKGKDDSKRGHKKVRLVEVREAQHSALAPRSRGQNDLNTKCLAKLLQIKREGAETQHNTTLKCGKMKGSPVRKHSGRGINTVNKEMKDSVENWLNVSGGFEFLDRVYEVKEGLGKPEVLTFPEVLTTVRKNTDIPSSSDVTSLHAWSVRSAGEGVPEAFSSLPLIRESLRKKNNSARPDAMSRVSCMGMQSGELHQPGQGVLSEVREEVQTIRNVKVQEDIINEDLGIDSALETHDPSNMCKINLQLQELTGFHSEPADSFEHVFQEEYREKTKVGGPQKPHEVDEGGASSVVAAQVAEKLDFSELQSQNKNSSCEARTQSSSDLEDKLTESEELELALLELVLKTVLRDDLVKNAKSELVLPKEEKSSATDQRRYQCIQVDHGVEASVLNTVKSDRVQDVKQSSSTQQASSDSAKSSGRDWPDYTCLAEKQSRSVSSSEDKDWPEYLGLDEEVAGKVEEDIDHNSSEKISITSVIETTDRVPKMKVPSAVSVTSQPSSSANDERESTQFPGLSSLAFASEPPQFKKFATHVAERSSTGVQTNDMTVGQPLNSVCVVPIYCLPDGRPFYPLYSTYPPYPVPEGPPHTHSMQSRPPVRSVHSVGTSATPEDVQGTSDIHPSKTIELQISNPKIESNLWIQSLASKNSSSISSASPFSSPTTPSTPISSPEHEARVASALAHHRRGHKRQLASFSSEYNNDESELRGEQTDRQTEQKMELQQIPDSLRDPLAENGHEESSRHLLRTSTLDHQLSGELVPGSLSSAPTSSRKELEVRPCVSYDDSGSRELADSYDGSGSSDLSVNPRMYSGVDEPNVNLKVKGAENLNWVPTIPVSRVPVNETRAQSPGEIHTFLASGREADGSVANLRRYPLEADIKYRERDFMSWSRVVRDQGLPFSEGEIEAGGLRSEGECGQVRSNGGFRRHNFHHSLDQDGDDVSEPGEISRIVAQQIRRTNSNSVDMGRLIQSLSEGEIKEGMLERVELAEMETVSRSAEEKSYSEKEDN